MMASVTPPTTSRRRKRLRASISSCGWFASPSVSHPDHRPSLQSGHNEANEKVTQGGTCFCLFFKAWHLVNSPLLQLKTCVRKGENSDWLYCMSIKCHSRDGWWANDYFSWHVTYPHYRCDAPSIVIDLLGTAVLKQLKSMSKMIEHTWTLGRDMLTLNTRLNIIFLPANMFESQPQEHHGWVSMF